MILFSETKQKTSYHYRLLHLFLGKKKKEFNPDAPKLDRVPFPDL